MFEKIMGLVQISAPAIWSLLGVIMPFLVNKIAKTAEKKLSHEKYKFALEAVTATIKGAYYSVSKISQNTEGTFDDQVAKLIQKAKEEFEKKNSEVSWEQLNGDALAASIAESMQANPKLPNIKD